MSAFKYVGDGSAFLEGVPARDLDDADLLFLDDMQLEAVKKSGLYEPVPKKAEPKKGGDD